MKNLVIFPPQWMPFNPHLAIPSIHSVLKNNNYDVKALDLNIEFYNKILTPEFMVESLNSAFENHNENAKLIAEKRAEHQNLSEFPKDFQRKYQRLSEIENIARANKYNDIIKNLPTAIATIRDKKNYYNLYLLDKAFTHIKKACDLLSGIYSPSKVNFLEVTAQIYYTIEDLKLNCEEVEGNIFHKFYEKILPEILNTEYDYIGVSIGDYTQLVPGLTLAMLLKQKTKAHINIGGNLFGRYTEILINNLEFFELFADSITYNEGEKPILELMKYLKGETNIEDVPNLIYIKDKTVKINDECVPLKINELFTPEFSGFPIEKYYSPEAIFNLQSSRNCYWQKCSFCTHHFGSKYAIKTTDTMIKEIKELQSKFGAKYFHFIDEAMSPGYLEKLSKKLIEENININFYIYGRLEKEFTPELLKLAFAAGLRLVLWGFESANERIYSLMNKGQLTSCDERQKIIRNAYEAGIWNHLFIMFGFPSESLDDAKETVHFLRDNNSFTSHSTGGTFVLLDGAPILKNLRKFSITKVQKIRSGFSFAHKFETYKGMKSEEVKELQKYKTECWNLKNVKYFNSSYREKLFLYVCKYGAKNISKMRDKIWI